MLQVEIDWLQLQTTAAVSAGARYQDLYVGKLTV